MPPALRCAIYARVSVADTQNPGLTSLDAQIEACEQYIASQAGLGWVLEGKPYTDDGVSGATLQRPGLRALLHDIREKSIDVLVVHRLDRLSRSLFDVSDLQSLLAVQGVALVSVTQHIDTQSPAGRLSLNLLASFAEYERELIGERTKDKLASTRRQGRWQGSGTPLGYGVDSQQRLVIVDPEAALVREIFNRYLASDNMAQLMDWLARRGVKTRKWVTREGKERGGQPMDRTSLYRILNNRMYIGEALFHGEWHSRIYPPIIDLDLWRSVQEKLSQRARRKGVPNETRNPLEFPLIGKIFWHDGRAYTVFKSSPRGKKQYRYYVAPPAQQGAAGEPPANLPTVEIHRVVVQYLRKNFRHPEEWLPMLLERAGGVSKLDEVTIRKALTRLDQAWRLFTRFTEAQTVFDLVSRVTIFPEGARMEINPDALIQLIGELAEHGDAIEGDAQ